MKNSYFFLILCLSFAILFIQSPNYQISNYESLIVTEAPDTSTLPKQKIDSIQDVSIAITSDADFGPSGLNFPGSGTSGDPYRIEGWMFTGSGALISIEDTRAHFVIDDNYFTPQTPGSVISTDNISNGKITANQIVGAVGADGIQLRNTNDTVVTGNSFIGTNYGVSIIDTRNVTVSDNFIYNCATYGIDIHGSKITADNLIKNNTIYLTNYGIRMDGLNFSTISHNNISLCLNAGIVIAGSSYNNFSYNYLLQNNFGIQQETNMLDWQSYNNSYTMNIFMFNTNMAIWLGSSSNYMLVEYNDFISNYQYSPITQAGEVGTDNIFQYNYWAGWTDPDTDVNGIVDQGYLNLDPYPRTTPNLVHSIHYLSPPHLISPVADSIITESPTIIEWYTTSDLLFHTVTYDISYSSDSGISWTTIASGLTERTYSWDITTLDNGNNYLILVNATCTEGFSIGAVSESSFTIQFDESTTTTTTKTATTTTSQPTSSKETTTQATSALSWIGILFGLLMVKKYGKKATK